MSAGGHIRQRGEAWELRYPLPAGPDGKRRVATKTFRGSKARADRELRRLMREVDLGTHGEAGGVTVTGWLDRWLGLIEPEVSGRTRERYTELCDGFIKPRLGATLLDRLDPAEIQKMMTELAAGGRRDGRPGGLGPTTRRHVYRCLSAALNRAVELGVLGRNPCDRLRKRLPRVERVDHAVPSMQQSADLLAAIRDKRVYWPVLLAVATGARRSEVLALKWRNVDLEHASVTVCEAVEVTRDGGAKIKAPKNGKTRSIAIPASVAAELRRHRVEQAQELLRLGVALNGDTLVCARFDGSMMLPTSLTHEFGKVAPLIDGRKPRLHDLRHGHATGLIAAGVNIKVVSERLGHSGIGITMDCYGHVLAGMQEEAAAKLDTALRPAITAP